MPNILCPKCDSTLAIADESVGQMVQCGSCQNVFQAVAIPPSKRRAADDEDDERPSKRKRSRRDHDEDDDEDDRPSQRKKRKRYHDDDDDDRRPALAGNGMATASMVLGIIALVIELPSFAGTVLFGASMCCAACGVLFWPGHALAVILAIIGVVLGLLAMKNPIRKGQWMAGLILSGISLILALLGVLINVLGFAAQAAYTPPPNQTPPNFNQPVQQQPKPNIPRR